MRTGYVFRILCSHYKHSVMNVSATLVVCVLTFILIIILSRTQNQKISKHSIIKCVQYKKYRF